MRRYILALAVFMAVVGLTLRYPAQVHADQDTSLFSGVWHASLDGLPGVTLTLAEDPGILEGTVVFYGIDKQERRILFADICTVLHAQVNGDTLSLEVKHHGKSQKIIHLHLVLSGKDKGQFRCTDCGSDAPTVEITRESY